MLLCATVALREAEKKVMEEEGLASDRRRKMDVAKKELAATLPRLDRKLGLTRGR